MAYSLHNEYLFLSELVTIQEKVDCERVKKCNCVQL